jgi:hypothetical protein
MRDHLVIPDNQVKPGVDISYVKPLAQLIMKRKPEVIVLLGDVGDFPSLSSYDRHKLQFEGRRYKEDLKSLHKFLEELTKPMRVFNKRQAATHTTGNGQSKQGDYFHTFIVQIANGKGKERTKSL